jgi:SAM-dependent methyltransferase
MRRLEMGGRVAQTNQRLKKVVNETEYWEKQAQKGFLASIIDPADRRGHKNDYIDLLQKMALEEVLELKGDETLLDFGFGSGRLSHWLAPKVKKIVGLEITKGMVDLAEKNRTAANVEFMLYDGIHFPVFSYPFDVILCVGVLQYMEIESLKRVVCELSLQLKLNGRFYAIEQASDDPNVERPSVKQYLKTFGASDLRCLKDYPIRDGRWWLLYTIRYGIIPRKIFPVIARKEILCRRAKNKIISHYQDHLFVLQKG